MQPADRAAEVRRAALFLAVSGVGTLADLAAVAGLLRLNTPILISVSVGWFVNVGVGYLLNRVVTFRDSTSSMTASTARYIVVVILSALIGIGGVSLAVTSGALSSEPSTGVVEGAASVPPRAMTALESVTARGNDVSTAASAAFGAARVN